MFFFSSKTAVCRGINIDISDEAIVTSRVKQSILKQRYEAKEGRMLERLLEEGDRVLEIGAGLGFISTLCAKDERVSSVLCIEANPHLIPFIRRTHQLNKVNVDVRNGIVVTDGSTGKMPFYIRATFWGSSLSAEHAPFKEVAEVDIIDFNALVAS